MRRCLAVAGILLGVLGSELGGQGTRAPAPPVAGPSTLAVYHVVIGQGRQYWEKYGHNMLWFVDPARGIDLAYNWGSFDFTSPDFLRRQLVGDPQYWVDAYPGREIIQAYQRSDRTITLQLLNFTPAQAQRAFEFARRNALPENRYYRYDYFRDNCSTRVRDAIDYALGGALRRTTQDTPVKLTYRTETLRLLDDMKLTQLGVHFALGQPADRPLSVWESMFIPMRMRDALRLVRIEGLDGRAAPLIAQERVLYESPRHRDRESNPRLWLPYLVIGVALGLELLTLGALRRRSRVADEIFRIEAGVFALIAGVLGTILLLAWTVTRHEFWYRNENLLLVNPLSLFLAGLLVASYWKPHLLRPAATVAVISAGMAVLAALLKLVPGFSQNNVPLIALLLPMHVALAASLWSRRGPRVETP